MLKEIEASGKKLFIAPDLIQVQPNDIQIPLNEQTMFHTQVRTFDTKNPYYETLDLGEEKIREFNPQMRIRDYEEAISVVLRLIGQSTGLGANFYNFDRNKVEVTATQAVLQHSEAYRTINVIKRGLTQALQQVVLSLVNY